jgi:hypothetical protein
MADVAADDATGAAADAEAVMAIDDACEATVAFDDPLTAGSARDEVARKTKSASVLKSRAIGELVKVERPVVSTNDHHLFYRILMNGVNLDKAYE